MKRLALALVFILALSGCQKTREPVSKNGFLLDTVITVTLYDSEDGDILEGVFDLCAAYEKVFSRTKPESEVYRLNHAGGEAVPVSADVRDVLEKALFYAEKTGGRYDVTICPVVDLWDFTGETPALPDPADIERELERVGWRNIVLEGDTVRLENDARIDLGSIAKGYIADRMADYLRDRGVGSAILNLGGNVMTVGGRPDGTPFRVGVQKPFELRNETIGVVEVAGRSVVSSGVYERSFTMDGVLYHHILDTATGYPARNGLAGVSVVSDHSVDGDALSTCLFLLGLEEGMALVEELPGVDAIFLTENGEDYFTSGFNGELRFIKK